jgi:hypothetical protein
MLNEQCQVKKKGSNFFLTFNFSPLIFIFCNKKNQFFFTKLSIDPISKMFSLTWELDRKKSSSICNHHNKEGWNWRKKTRWYGKKKDKKGIIIAIHNDLKHNPQYFHCTF